VLSAIFGLLGTTVTFDGYDEALLLDTDGYVSEGSGENVFIEYLYAYSMDNKSANIVLKPDNIQKCIEVLQKHKMELVSASSMYKI